MSTKAVLSNNRVDITNNYKPPEGELRSNLGHIDATMHIVLGRPPPPY